MDRSKGLNAGLSATEARRRRDETSVKLRKQRREEQMKKKRAQNNNNTPAALTEAAPAPASAPCVAELCVPTTTNLASLRADMSGLVQAIHSENPDLQKHATTQFRKLLSIERDPPITDVIKTGVVPRFIQLLQRVDLPELQFEAAWALTNVASGTSEHTMAVVQAGAVPVFVHLLSSPNDDVREQAVWALGNIAGDCPKLRDFVLSQNALEPIVNLCTPASRTSLLRNATWTLSNFCRGKPQPDFALVSRALPTLTRLIFHNDTEVVTDACWALSYLSDGPNDRIQAVLDAQITDKLASLLLHQSSSVQTPALRTVGNIVTGTDEQTQTMIDSSILPGLVTLLKHSKRGIRKEACWTISNITAGLCSQINEVVQAGIFPPLIRLLRDAEFDVRKEAAWAVSNATSGGSAEHVKHLVDHGCVPPLCELLSSPEPRIVGVALEAVENILRHGMEIKETECLESNPYGSLVEEADGFDKIHDLQSHTNEDIYNKALHILSTYCVCDEEDSDNEVEPEVAANGQFNFAMDPSASGSFVFAC